MSSWSCSHDVNGTCLKVGGAYCRPGMKGCILFGKVTFGDGRVPDPVWPPGHPRAAGGPGSGPGGDERSRQR